MHIAIPVERGRLAEHFGRCTQVMLMKVDPQNCRVLSEQRLTMPPHQPGVFPAWLAEQQVNIVIAGGMGPKALALFAQAGIQVVTGAARATPLDLVADYLAGNLTEGANPCHHGPDHQCDHDAPQVRPGMTGM